MARNWFARPLTTITDISQKFSPTSNISVIGIRIMFLYKNIHDTGLTGLSCNVTTDRGGVPQTLVGFSSSSWSSADISTLAHGRKEIYFEMTPFHLKSGNNYHINLSATSYTGTDTQHIAWAVDFGDPTNTATGSRSTHTIANLGTWPCHFELIAADL